MCWEAGRFQQARCTYRPLHYKIRCQGALRCYLGIWNCGSTIIKEEGVRSLWKGLTPFAVHLTLKYALRMGTNAFYQSLLRDKVKAPLLPTC